MDTALILVFLYIVLLIFNKLAMKWASHVLDHKTTTIFIPTWVLIGLLASYPVFENEVQQAFVSLQSTPEVAIWVILKGTFFYYYLQIIQKLRQQSLSSAHYAGPIGISLSAVGAYFLGESLSFYQWVAMLLLGISGVVFMYKGHLNDIDPTGRQLFLKVVLLSAVLIMIDHSGVQASHWYVYLLFSSMATLFIALLKIRSKHVWSKALFNKTAVITGIVFVLHELVKYYQMVTITPASVLNAAGLSAGPIIMVLSAIIWKERTVKEQFLWGLWAMLLLVPLVFLK